METTELWVLFTSSFLSATLLPGGSEANIIYLLTQPEYSPWTIIGVATVGNTLGGWTNFVIGALAARGIRLRYFENEQRQDTLKHLRRYGPGALLFAWLPVVGDPLCLAAGYLRVNAWTAFACMGAGKCLRYMALVFGLMGVFE